MSEGRIYWVNNLFEFISIEKQTGALAENDSWTEVWMTPGEANEMVSEFGYKWFRIKVSKIGAERCPHCKQEFTRCYGNFKRHVAKCMGR